MTGEKRDTRAIRQDNIITTREQKITAIWKFTLFSDTFARVVFEDTEACQYVLRILTGDRKLQLRWVKTQYVLSKLVSHDAWLDVLSERVRFLKYTEKGWDYMCEVTDLFWRSGYVVGEEEGEKKGEKKASVVE